MYNQNHIVIDVKLFVHLVNYFYEHLDYSDPNYSVIHSLINEKLDALYRHNVFSIYKTSLSSSEKNAALKKYLDSIGINSSFLDVDDFYSNSE